MVAYDCRNQGRVSLSHIRRDLRNEKSEQRRRVGSIHILHSAAPGCPRLKVVQHLCHFGPGIIWAGGQGQGNICISSESLDLCPITPSFPLSLSHRNPKEQKISFSMDSQFCFRFLPHSQPYSSIFSVINEVITNLTFDSDELCYVWKNKSQEHALCSVSGDNYLTNFNREILNTVLSGCYSWTTWVIFPIAGKINHRNWYEPPAH